MKIHCRKSGLELSVSHVPSLTQTTVTGEHPVFTLSPKQLWRYSGIETITDKCKSDLPSQYLITLAALDVTGLVHFNCPAIITEKTQAIIAANWTPLWQIVSDLLAVRYEVRSESFPHIQITKDTRDLSSLSTWIAIWRESLESYTDTIRKRESERKHKIRSSNIESKLARCIKSPMRAEKYSHVLAEWAELAADFPVSLSTYWKEIIIKSYNREALLGIETADIQELLDHCIENIETGTIFSHHLFETLESALQSNKGFFEILSDSPDAQELQSKTLEVIKKGIGQEEPKRNQFPSQFAYVRAKLAWQVAQGS